MPIEITNVTLSAVLTSLLARRTARGKAHVVLSEADYGDFVAEAANDRRLLNAIRNQVTHSTCVSFDDDLRERLRAALSEVSAEQSSSPALSVQRNRAWLQSGLLHTEMADGGTVVAEPALALTEAFLDQIVRNGDQVVAKLDVDEATRLGKLAADEILAGARWSQIVGDRIDTTSASDLLGISRQALSKRQTSGSLLGLPGHGTTWYPIWQFDIEARSIRPEVRDTIGAFRDVVAGSVDPFLIAAWATRPQPEDLDGISPSEWLSLGKDVEQLRVAARRAAERLAE